MSDVNNVTGLYRFVSDFYLFLYTFQNLYSLQFLKRLCYTIKLEKGRPRKGYSPSALNLQFTVNSNVDYKCLLYRHPKWWRPESIFHGA